MKTIYFLFALFFLYSCTPAPSPTSELSLSPTHTSEPAPNTPSATSTAAASSTAESTIPVPDPTDTPNANLPPSFFQTFGGSRQDRGINLMQTQDGGFAVIGYTNNFDAQGEDVYLVRLDPAGKLLWSQIYGGEHQDNGWAILETEDHGFVILGSTSSFGAGNMDIYLLRVDQDGQLLWERTFGGTEDEFGWDLAAAPDGGFAIAGQTESFGQGQEDGYLVRVDSDGEELWAQTFGGDQEDRLFSITNTSEGGFALAGTTRSFGSGLRDAYILRTDAPGNLVSEESFGESEDDVAHAIRRTNDGGMLITGYTRSFGAQQYDVWLIKLDQEGAISWQQVFGGEANDRAIYGEQTADGGFILTGYTQGFDAVGWDVLLIKTDSLGEVIWQKIFGGRAEDTGYTVHQSSDLGFALTGRTYSFGEGNGDMFLIRVDHDGNGLEE